MNNRSAKQFQWRVWLTKWRLVWLSIALLFAIALNWPVAWMWMLKPPGPGSSSWSVSIKRQRALWNELVPNGKFDEYVQLANKTKFIGYTRLRLQGGDVMPSGLQDSRVRNLKVEWSGFPFRSVWCYRVWDSAAGTNKLIGGIEITATEMAPNGGNYGWIDSLPYMPAWRGLIVNTLIYLMLMVSPFFVLPWMIRMWKALPPQPGLCPKCKYDVRASDGCPECGWKRDM